MDIPEAEYDHLVEQIYHVVEQPESWPALAKKLATLLNVTYVQIEALDLNYQALSYMAGGGDIDDITQALSQVLYLHFPISSDPRWSEVLRPERQGWYQCHHHLDETFVQQSRLFQEILLPINFRYVAVHNLLLDEKLCVILAIHTSEQEQPLNNEQMNFLNRLMPHFKRMVHLQRQLYEFSNNSIAGYALINKMPQPIVLLNLAGAIVHTNAAVSRLVEITSLIRIKDSQLVIQQPFESKLQENLQQLEHVYRSKQIDPTQLLKNNCIKIHGNDNETLYIFATLLASEREIKTFGIRPLVMLTFYCPSLSPSIDMQLLNAAFDLTPAEYKVAVALVEGYLPKEIAQKHKVEIDTVKKQMRSIFKKTSTHRQADLIMLLSNFPKTIYQ